MRKLAKATVILAGLGTSGCVALAGAGAGAAAVACTADDVDCPPGEVADDVEEEVDVT